MTDIKIFRSYMDIQNAFAVGLRPQHKSADQIHLLTRYECFLNRENIIFVYSEFTYKL